LIKTLRDEGVKIAYIFCEASIGSLHSEVDFVKILLARILEQLPTLILELPHLLNARTLQRALTLEKIWEIMEAVAKRLPTYFFLVVNRFDVFQAKMQDLEDQVVGNFLNLGVDKTKLRMIITSSGRPTHTIQERGSLSWVWLDTSTNPAREANKRQRVR